MENTQAEWEPVRRNDERDRAESSSLIEPFARQRHRWNMDEAHPVSDSLQAASLDLQDLIDSHGERLLRSACLLCGDATEARDLVQETFVQALKSAHRFRGDSAAYTWLHGILLNLCRRHLRKQKRLVFGDERLVGETVESRAADDLDRDFRDAGLAIALQKLTSEHREVIVLRYYENMKIEEIARQTGASKGTVKSRLHYAVRYLEQLIPKEMNLFVSSGTYNHEP
jgi:RNA polymerase sigma-70 factor (ECF subfamily)